MISVHGIKVNVTTFPDKTSQVWKLDQEIFDKDAIANQRVIKWDFENEGEIFQIIQLIHLLNHAHDKLASHARRPELILECPYLPYARQDKETTNTSCFALEAFCGLFSSIAELRTFDAHNPAFFNDFGKAPFDFVNTLPSKEINQIVSVENIGLIVYPDKGAAERYSHLSEIDFVCADKVRDQLTGEITGMTMPDISEGSNILVVDDIIQNGRTFIELAKLIMPFKPVNLILYGSHAFCSAGLQIFWDAGYEKIYDRNGLFATKS